MGPTLVIALIFGAVIFTASFFMPDINRGVGKQMDEEEERRIIQDMMKEEMKKFREDMEDATQECIEDNRDKMERAMDRITNEKMNAVYEYSDTVLEQIHKDHEEAVFLYDMLNNKHTQVKNTAAEINQLTKTVQVKAKEIKEVEAKVAEAQMWAKDVKETPVAENKTVTKPIVNNDVVLADIPAIEPVEMVSFENFAPEKPVVDEADFAEPKPAKKESKKSKTDDKVPVADEELDLMFASNNNSANNNEEILRLHKAGKSNMAIAKELGLGLGEVKLVIDLFEGI